MEYRISNKMKDMKPSAIREIFKSLTNPEVIAFAAGNPAPESFPQAAIAEISARIFRDEPVKALQYGITEGYPPLREAVSARLKSKFGIGGADDETIIVSGGQQGLELACKVMCDQGDVMLCENPSFIGALNAFRSLGCVLVGVPMGDDGIDTAALEEALDRHPEAKLLYTIPTFHNPAGITTPYETRKAVYELCCRHGVLILEDNPYGELRFDGEEIPTYKSMDTEGIVIYCGSFSKILSSGMRVGFVCAPRAVISKMVVAKQVEDVHTNMFSQMVCASFMTDYDLDAHIDGIRALYRRKCHLMLDELDKKMPDCVTYTRPEGGLFIWCTLPDRIPLDAFVQEASRRLVAVVPGTAFNCDPAAPSQAFRLNYSTPSEEQIVRGIGILADIVREMMA